MLLSDRIFTSIVLQGENAKPHFDADLQTEVLIFACAQLKITAKCSLVNILLICLKNKL